MDADDLMQLAYIGERPSGGTTPEANKIHGASRSLVWAFNEHEEEFDRSAMSSSSSSKSVNLLSHIASNGHS